MTLLSNWLLIDVTGTEKSRNGLFLPASSSGGEGTVKAVGPKAGSVFKVGQRVLFDKTKQQNAGTDLVTCVMVRADEVRAILTEVE